MSQAKPAPLRLPLLALVLMAVALWLGGSLERVDNALGDEMLRWHAQSRTPPADIVLVAIDQHSLEELNELAGPCTASCSMAWRAGVRKPWPSTFSSTKPMSSSPTTTRCCATSP
jgi:CHASE2 domain-containing sensor protein